MTVPNGNVLVADTGSGAVKEILAAGGYTTVNTLATGFTSPLGVALGSDGNIYVADGNSIAIKNLNCASPSSLTLGSLVITDNALNASAPNYITQSVALSGSSPLPPLSSPYRTIPTVMPPSPSAPASGIAMSLAAMRTASPLLIVQEQTVAASLLPALQSHKVSGPLSWASLCDGGFSVQPSADA